ncbi:hypothetical protein ACJIZ3_014788 [Penstemon smallii]|uniref:Transmembrane protein n=1 Tax=Penstemon smallii TaxID=265156 RepID=A0ABD3RKT0_9LAMI
MNLSNTSHTIWKWNSPIPYLYGGLTIIFVLIVFALAILICTRQKDSSETTTTNTSHEIELRVVVKPLVVVVMAGDDMPKYLAKPSLE